MGWEAISGWKGTLYKKIYDDLLRFNKEAYTEKENWACEVPNGHLG